MREDGKGGLWIATSTSVSPNAVTAALVHSMLSIDIKKASEHYCGAGIQDGIDWDSSLSLVRNIKCNITHKYKLKCTVESVMSGSCWPGSRINEIYPEVSPQCSRCNHPCESALHTFWQCPANDLIDNEAIRNTNYLGQRASNNADELPCLWLRGV